jgi:hypothetical protein
MRDPRPIGHAAKQAAMPGIGKPALCPIDKGAMNIMVWPRGCQRGDAGKGRGHANLSAAHAT